MASDKQKAENLSASEVKAMQSKIEQLDKVVHQQKKSLTAQANTTNELDFLHEIIRLRTAGLTEDLLKKILRVLLKFSSSSQGLIGTIDDENFLSCIHIRNEDIKEKNGNLQTSFPIEVCRVLWADVFINNKSQVQNRVSSGVNGHGTPDRSLAVPIMHEDRLIGMILVQGRGSNYTNYEYGLLESASELVAQDLYAKGGWKTSGKNNGAFPGAVNGDAKYARAISSANDGIWEWDLQTNEFNVSENFVSKLGYEEGKTKFDGETWLELLHPDDKENYRLLLLEHMVGHTDLFYTNHRMKHSEGSYKAVLSRGTVIRDSEGKVRRLVGLLTDYVHKNGSGSAPRREIGDLQKMKLDSITTLADGLAHEINNPINGILNYAQLIFDKSDQDKDTLKYSMKIIEQSKRIAKILRNLKNMAKPKDEEKKKESLSEIIKDALSLVESRIQEQNIDLDVDLSENLPPVFCSRSLLQQTFLDLITNAIDSLEEKDVSVDRKLSILADSIEKGDETWIRTYIEDNGIGMSEKIVEQVFDPFFTTKSRSIFAGLGLSIADSTINDHGGSITVKSEKGKFARFIINFPAEIERKVGAVKAEQAEAGEEI